MKEKLEEEILHTILVPQAAVQWVKYEKEIRIDGKMFDIKSFTIKNGDYIFTGLYDDEETALNNYLQGNLNQKKDAGNEALSSLFKMLQSTYHGGSDDILVSTGIPIPYSPFILRHMSSPFKNILTPPPQPLITYQNRIFFIY